MKYTHYHTKHEVRGNIISLDRYALTSQEAFERELGQKVKSFTRTSERYGTAETVEVDFSDGSHHCFDMVMGIAYPKVFLSEEGLYYPTGKHGSLAVIPCTPDEDKPLRGELLTKSSDKYIATDFMSADTALSIQRSILAGHGVTIPLNKKRPSATTVPASEIRSFTVTMHPYGG